MKAWFSDIFNQLWTLLGMFIAWVVSRRISQSCSWLCNRNVRSYMGSYLQLTKSKGIICHHLKMF
jgi:hypothetical protein